MAERTPPRLMTLILLTSLSVLSLNMFLPSLSRIAADFEADYALVSLSIGGYLAVSSVLQIIMGPLSDLYGRRPVMLGALSLFTLASLGCLFAPNITVFLGFRMLQSGVIGGMVLSRAIVRDMHGQKEAARLLGVIGMAMALAPLLAPVLGGVLDEVFGWRATFLLFVVLGLCMLVLVFADLGETNHNRAARFTDQFRSYPALFRDRLFWAWCGGIVFSVGGFYAFLGGAPKVGEEAFGLSPAVLGLGMGSISAGFMLGNYLYGRLSPRVGGARVMVAGRVLALIGPLAGVGLFVMGLGNVWTLFGPILFVGLGNGLTLPGANAGVMSVSPRLAGSASGLSGALTVAGGAVVTGIAGWAVSTRLGGEGLLLVIVATSSLSLLCTVLAVRMETRRGGLD
ncbi:MAG: Bcr/CflA family efflux MFS transporter [Rhodobacteraceae bacterium]|jgi:DHA1 family bicyclomycin/chloramphenicol resistance-like MFS transporter|nr:Bcr/CflA family efflux MFS transporter [Paracoccaceae bacterium]